MVLDLGAVRRAGAYTVPTRPSAVPGLMILDWSPREVTVDIVASGK
jgi:hypothetical protein